MTAKHHKVAAAGPVPAAGSHYNSNILTYGGLTTMNTRIEHNTVGGTAVPAAADRREGTA